MKALKGKLAISAKVGEKGQIVIPKEMRDMFGIRTGDSILLLADEKRGIAIPPKSMLDKLSERVMEGGEDE